MSLRGRFVTLEGIEGVGKSTQAALLADWFEGQGRSVLRTREPGGTPTAEAIRKLLKQSSGDEISAEAELLLIFAARTMHAAKRLRPALTAGHWVVCDRFVDASFAYQGAGRGLGAARVAGLAEWLVPDLTPDATLWLDLPVDVALRRLAGRGERDRFEREDRDFFRRVRDGYAECATREPGRFLRVNAEGSPETVQARCRELVERLLDARGG
ncbi:MAG: dTMP kinase [Gammaproteobacteria bacterium]